MMKLLKEIQHDSLGLWCRFAVGLAQLAFKCQTIIPLFPKTVCSQNAPVFSGPLTTDGTLLGLCPSGICLKKK